MTRSLFLAATVALSLSACSKGAVSGTVTDGLTKVPLSETRLLARSESVDLTCQVFEAITDASGVYSFDSLCVGTTYTLSSGDDNRFLSGTIEVSGDAQLADNAVVSWLGPEGLGVYIVDAKGAMVPQRTKSDVKTATIFGTKQDVRYPDGTPGAWPSVSAGEYLMIVGQATIDSQKIFPLIVSPEVKFDPDREGITDYSLGGPWSYIGAKMTAEGEYTAVAAELDSSKVITASAGERTVKFIPGDALPAGKYVMLKDNARRTYMFQFGAPAAEKTE